MRPLLASAPTMTDPPRSERQGVQPVRARAEDQPRERWLPPRIAIVLALGLVLRLALVAWLHGQPLYVWDERDYDVLATNIVQHGEFAFVPGTPVSLRPPLYPAALALVYSVTGEHNFTAMRIIQALLGTSTAYVVFLLARRVYDERTGMVAAAICAFYPSLVATSGLVLTETLFTLLLCGSCLLMERFLTTGRTWALAWFGVVLALGALTRSVLWLFPAPLIVFLLVCDPASSWRRRLTHIAIALAAFALVIAPWAIRNTRLQQTFTAVDVMGGRNFMMGNYAHTPFDRPWDAISAEGDKAWHTVLRRETSVPPNITQGQLDKLALKYGLNYISRHPFETLQRDTAKFFHFWQLERELIAGLHQGYWGGANKAGVLMAAAAILGSYTLVMVAGIFGMLVRPPQQWRMHLFMVLVMAYVCGIHTLVFAHSRYHLPLMPLIGIWAAAAWTGRERLFQQWRNPRAWTAAIICGILAASWIREVWVEAGRF
jgi:4-amino-4-deoxy-L-arabinose transferase-like glycosyltransferase